jgi:TolB-like protein
MSPDYIADGFTENIISGLFQLAEMFVIDRNPAADCLLFDTTNYYTFMASHTPSEIARRVKNKSRRH